MSEAQAESKNFNVPDGYVLVPKDIYDLLMNSNRSPQKSDVVVKKAIHLRVIRPLHLGDIRTQLSPGEVVSWIPYESITIRGRKHDTLGSFLSVWNKQDSTSPTYEETHPRFFEVENPEVYDEIFQNRKTRARTKTEIQRLRQEEKTDDPTVSNARVEGVEFGEEMPPRGSQERKEAITRRSVERLNVGRQAGLEDDLKVEDFKVEAQGGGEQKVITKIDGPTAEAKEISPLLNTETSTKSKVRR